MKAVLVSDYSYRPFHTGFSRVSRNILEYLHARKHSVVEVGVGYQGRGPTPPWPIYSTTANGGRLEGQDIAPLVASEFGADILLLLMDVPDAAWAVQYVDRRENRPLSDECIQALDERKFVLALYAPIDGARIDGSVPPPWPQIFDGFDALAATSKFGQNLMGPRASCIPHGVDLNMFHPADRMQARATLGLPPDNFTLLYVAVNKRRKAVPAFFEAASKAMDRLKDVPFTVIFHGDKREDWYDLQGLSDSYGLEKRGATVFATPATFLDNGLHLLYSSADLFLGLSGGEGFCVPVVESQSCRVPALVTDYSAVSELVPTIEREFCRIPVKSLIPQPTNNIAWAWPDTDVAAERIEEFYKDKRLRVTLRKAAFETAQAFRWERILPKFEAWLEKSIEAKKSAPYKIPVEAV